MNEVRKQSKIKRIKDLKKIIESDWVVFSWFKMFHNWQCVKEYSKSFISIDKASPEWDKQCEVRWHKSKWIIYIDEVIYS